MEEKICPYPGLRPFNEEESIFFRGREEHIQAITSQLQEKKFLMITGASGDGKSSLVYAGIIPNARAGFFKAKFNNWLIADFRPERSPLKNMAAALNDRLGYNDVAYVEKELGFGFSSLVNLYKKSPYYLDTAAAEYTSLPDAEQKKTKRKAANLFILVDQFEEFFTNTENYNNGKAGVKSQLVVNLLLETAKIALAEDLPIYIICTMRSDYIGQCAAFRGLPEYIGYSQFFVPRLKRKEMHQVIEEPAMLSGNKISNRLIETLINDCDGQDQLPILQHALNRIWRVHAEDGSEEMDMIHYAKVGGLDRALLPEEQKLLFADWYKKQSEYKQRFLDTKASLSNVLNAHARELYEVSVDYCKKHIGHAISREEAHELLKQIFTCLTKINDSRAVRNRATVLEVKQIVGKNIDNKLVEGLVNVFREPENTLLKPFIGGDFAVQSESLTDKDILDITHESLIRNWTDLTEWTKKDNENVSIIEDLKKQVHRWEEQGRSKDYLLAIGSLSYFKNWYDSVNLNPYWLRKYDSETISPKQKLQKAEAFIQPAKDFLRQSEATIKRKRRAVVFIAAAIGLVLLGFTSWAFKERNLAMKQMELAHSAEVRAMVAKDSAENAKKNADRQREFAQKSAVDAETARNKSKLSEMAALQAKKQAEIASEQAKQNEYKAHTEEERAKQALAESEKAKEQAMQSKEEAERERKKVEKISNMILARSVALNSDLFRKEPQIQGLMALQAYNFMVDNGGNEQEPLIYRAIRNAYQNLNKDSLQFSMAATTDFEQRSAVFLGETNMLTADKEKNIYKWDLKTGAIAEKGKLPTEVAIDVVCFTEWPNILVSGHKSGRSMVWDISNISKPVLVKSLAIHTAPMRVVCSSASGGLFATAAKDSILAVWKYAPTGVELLKKIQLKSPVRDMLFMDTNSLLLTLENGIVQTIDITSGAIVSLKNEGKAWCMKLNKNKTLLAIGYLDGRIRLFDPSKITAQDGLVYTFPQSNSGIEEMAFDKKGELLAVAAADKSIKIINLANKGQKPIEIKDIRSKTRDILFDNQQMLYALCADHKIRKIESSTSKMAALFCNLLNRNLTQQEWTQNISETVPYQKTCKNK